MDRRSAKHIVHPMVEILRTRLQLIALGFEDQSDADLLRDDPACLVAVSSRRGNSPLATARHDQRPGLPSQPTMSRHTDALTRDGNLVTRQRGSLNLKKPRPGLRSSLDDLKALHKNLMDENVIQRWNKDAHWLDYCAKFLRLANQLQLLAHPGDAQGNSRTLVELAVHIGLVSGTDQPQGIKAGDRILAIEGSPVLTFADLQHAYNKVDRSATRLQLTVQRGPEAVQLDLALPPEWWWTDLYHRYWSVEPLVYFENRPLSREEKEALKLDPEGFASKITEVQPTARALNVHELEVGDIIYEVDGATRDPVTTSCRAHIKLRKLAGSVIRVRVLRDGQPLSLRIDSEKLNFRKE